MKLLLTLLLISVICSQTLPEAKEKWSIPKEIVAITKFVNPNTIDNPYINPKGDEIYFETEADIFYIKKKDTTWISLNLITGLTPNLSESLPKIAPDNKTLYFLNGIRLLSMKRKSSEHPWDNLREHKIILNKKEIALSDYYIINDTTLIIENGYNLFKTTYNQSIDDWNELQSFSEFPNFGFGIDFLRGNITSKKIYHSKSIKTRKLINGKYVYFYSDCLVVRYNDLYSKEYMLNFNSELDSILYNKFNSTVNHYHRPSFTENGQTIFFLVYTKDSTFIYSSNMIQDENGELVGINENDKNSSIENSFLYQNYPNPFNPSTKIKYKVALDGDVIIKLYDLLGREKEVLVNHYHKAGEYEINLNMQNYSSGIYFYSLKTGNYFKTNKLLLIK